MVTFTAPLAELISQHVFRSSRRAVAVKTKDNVIEKLRLEIAVALSVIAQWEAWGQKVETDTRVVHPTSPRVASVAVQASADPREPLDHLVPQDTPAPPATVLYTLAEAERLWAGKHEELMGAFRQQVREQAEWFKEKLDSQHAASVASFSRVSSPTTPLPPSTLTSPQTSPIPSSSPLCLLPSCSPGMRPTAAEPTSTTPKPPSTLSPSQTLPIPSSTPPSLSPASAPLARTSSTPLTSTSTPALVSTSWAGNKFSMGDYAVVRGLAKAVHLNGTLGCICGYIAATERYVVNMGESEVLIKAANLEREDELDSDRWDEDDEDDD